MWPISNIWQPAKMLDPVQVAAAPRPRELSKAAFKVRRWKRKTLKRACKDQEAVLNRAYDARRVGDVANFEKVLTDNSTALAILGLMQ